MCIKKPCSYNTCSNLHAVYNNVLRSCKALSCHVTYRRQILLNIVKFNLARNPTFQSKFGIIPILIFTVFIFISTV